MRCRPEWPGLFRRYAEQTAAAFGEAALQIEHIGSTAVPGLAAKPIIDMLVVVENSGDEDAYLPAMESCGYVLRVREPEFEEHRMFRTADEDVHDHVLSRGSPEIRRYLRFRDLLRGNAAFRAKYQGLKHALARQNWPDMNAYAAAKTELIGRDPPRVGHRLTFPVRFGAYTPRRSSSVSSRGWVARSGSRRV